MTRPQRVAVVSRTLSLSGRHVLLNSFQVIVCGRRIDVVVEGGPNTSIDEIAEG